MTKLELDRELYILSPIFVVGSLASLGLVSTDVLQFIDLGSTVVETGNIDWTIGRAMAILALGGVFVNRDDMSLDAWNGVELWIVYATIGLVLAPPIFPAFQETVAQGPAAVMSFIVQSTGFALVSYIN